jgi:hypothetical protein
MAGKLSISLGVMVTRAALANPWQEAVWRASGVVLGSPSLRAGSLMWQDDAAVHFFAGATTLSLHADETEQYRANLEQQTPLLYVVLQSLEDSADSQPPLLHLVTAAPDEAEAYQEGDATRVGCVLMPRPIATLVAAFINESERRLQSNPAFASEHRHGR